MSLQYIPLNLYVLFWCAVVWSWGVPVAYLAISFTGAVVSLGSSSATLKDMGKFAWYLITTKHDNEQTAGSFCVMAQPMRDDVTL